MPLILVALFSLGLFFGLIIFRFYYRKTISDSREQKRTLMALQKLDEIMMSSLSLEDVAQRVTDAIAFELNFEIGVLTLIDDTAGVLKRVAMSRTPLGLETHKFLPVPYQRISIPLYFKDNLLIQAIQDGKRKVVHDMHYLFMPALDEMTSRKIQQTLGIKTSLIYPVFAKGKPIGAMIFSIKADESSLSVYELEMIERLVNVMGIALDNAHVYQKLRDTTKELEIVNEKLKVLDQLKDDFVSIASHELRTPMTAIRSYAWMALNRAGITLPPNLQKYIARILLSTERLINLVNDMLNVSRIESGKIEINPEPVDLHALVKDIVDELYFSKSQEKKINFIILEKQVPKVFADPEKLRQVFLNLVGNSLKFTPHGGKIIFDFFTDGLVVETSVTDTGVGISKEDLSKLFHKFGRLDNSYTAAATSGGTGLGLYISKNLVDLMHGKISVSSAGVGKGATFTISLPIATKEKIEHTQFYTIKPREGEAKPLLPVSI